MENGQRFLIKGKSKDIWNRRKIHDSNETLQRKVGHTYTSQKKKIVIDTEAPIIEAMKADGWVDGSYSLTIPVTDKVSGVEKISWVSGNKKVRLQALMESLC